jgi:hypothetical protein
MDLKKIPIKVEKVVAQVLDKDGNVEREVILDKKDVDAYILQKEEKK